MFQVTPVRQPKRLQISNPWSSDSDGKYRTPDLELSPKLSTPIQSRKISVEPNFLSRLRPNPVIVVKCGSTLAARVDRKAILRAIPALESMSNALSFRYLMLSTKFLHQHHEVITQKSLKCFLSLCEAMYLRDAPLERFPRKSLQGAEVLARGVGANGVMVLCGHLLRSAVTVPDDEDDSGHVVPGAEATRAEDPALDSGYDGSVSGNASS